MQVVGGQVNIAAVRFDGGRFVKDGGVFVQIAVGGDGDVVDGENIGATGVVKLVDRVEMGVVAGEQGVAVGQVVAEGGGQVVAGGDDSLVVEVDGGEGEVVGGA